MPLFLSFPQHFLDHLFSLFSYHTLHRLFQYAFGRHIQIIHDSYGIALVLTVGEDLEQHGVIGQAGREKTVEVLQIFLLGIGGEIFIA